MRHGSLFSGIGGFDLAAEWMGWENVFHCEWNEFGQKILKHYWPNAKSYGDITKTDFTEWRGKVDIVSGGFPCQPYSQAGKRKGKADDRHLWPEMLRAIREIQPRWVVGENVPGLLNWERGMVLDEIKADLEAAGFEVFPSLVLPACGKNAPHRRDRLWIIANAESLRINREKELENDKGQSGERRGCDTNNYGEVYDKNGSAVAANTNSRKRQKRSNINGERKNEKEDKTGVDNRPPGPCIDRNVTNSRNQRLQRSKINGNIGEIWEDGNKQFAGHVSSAWQKFPTQPPVCGRNDGIPNRVDRIKALGNAIVPQVAYEIFKAIEEFERRTNDTT